MAVRTQPALQPARDGAHSHLDPTFFDEVKILFFVSLIDGSRAAMFFEIKSR